MSDSSKSARLYANSLNSHTSVINCGEFGPEATTIFKNLLTTGVYKEAGTVPFNNVDGIKHNTHGMGS